MLSRRAVLATAALSLAVALPTVRPARAAGETFRLGDRVEVRLVEAAPVAGALRFELLSEGKTRAGSGKESGGRKSGGRPFKAAPSGRPPGIRDSGTRHRGSRR